MMRPYRLCTNNKSKYSLTTVETQMNTTLEGHH